MCTISRNSCLTIFRTTAIAIALIAFSYGLHKAHAQSKEQYKKPESREFEWLRGTPCAGGICFVPPASAPVNIIRPQVMAPIGTSCELSWSPSVLAPAFYGHQNYVADDGKRLRIFYPSSDGSPQGAPMLHCGPYPLVLFLHGGSPNNADPDHFMDWIIQPAQLARSGYVVVVPDFGDSGPSPFEGGFDHLEKIVGWVRNSWSGAGQLSDRSAVVGHSYGALYGARYTVAHPTQVQAYVSLSGVWNTWPANINNPLSLIQQPSMFTWGTGSLPGDVEVDANISAKWPARNIPIQHRITIQGGLHYDYLPPSLNDSFAGSGPCGLTPFVVGDFVTLFLSRYVPPPRWAYLSWLIGNNLVVHPVNLTQEQQSFVGGHLASLEQISSANGCRLTHGWELFSHGGSVTYGP